MQFRGKAIGGSTVLTILGVVCFATVLVAAAVLTSGIASFSETTVDDPANSIVLTKTQQPTQTWLEDDTTYTFTADVPTDLESGATLTITITKSTAFVKADITSVDVAWNSDGTPDSVVLTDPSSNIMTLTYTIPVGVTAADTIPCDVIVAYHATGAYTVAVSISGTPVAA